MSDKVIHIKSQEEHDALIKSNKFVVLDFHAVWCGPCHMIAPVYEQLAGKHENVKFAKVDVDNVSDIAQNYGITAMPTFIFLRDGEQVKLIKGANQVALEQAVSELQNE
ncbi:unnamed protein product [Rhizoctonia solani]|uniref:Thioredoxin n=1 Tax=Rhizoctonia solani TaxID=456999 RepID=A0A8H3AVV8_9AGAM|nr:unnamed protein product [Rhizoctonia solani]